MLLAFGEEKSYLAWEKDGRSAVSRKAIKSRVEAGWDPELAIVTPGAKRDVVRKPVAAFGEVKTLSAWSRDPRCVVSRRVLRERLENGLSPEDALTRPLQRTPDRSKREAFGESKILREWSEDPRCRVNLPVLYDRTLKGWSVEDAMTIPHEEARRKSHRQYEAFGEWKTMAEWLADPRSLDVEPATISKRINTYGMTFEEAITTEIMVGTSRGEMVIAGWLDEWGIEHLKRDRVAINPKELDIYIPSKNFAIEYNGLRWHSDIYRGRLDHHVKYRLCREAGIRLVQIFEDDLTDREDIVKRMIAARLGVSTEQRVSARATEAVVVDAAAARVFYAEHHIQGFAAATEHLALVADGPVAMASFLREGDGEWTLVRYATSAIVRGGLGKLLAAFCRTHEWSSIKTFADHLYSEGALYERLGFVRDGLVPPDYQYLTPGNRRHHKSNYRKGRFERDPDLVFHEDMTESELADLNGLARVWDAGKVRYVLRPAGARR